MAHNTSSDSDNEITTSRPKLFQRERPIHQVLGGGKVADVLLWRNRNVSAALLIAITVIWFLFEVVDYNFVTLLCHISITTMLLLFIWSTLGDVLKRNGPQIPDIILQDSFFQDLASTFHKRFNQLIETLLYISCGKDLPRFFLTLVSFYILSVIGNCFSFFNLLYIGNNFRYIYIVQGFLCMQTLPFMYERYEEEINNVVGDMVVELRNKYRRFDKRYLNKIPRGPVKEKKNR
ncbi:reticulon-like protein B9 [Senna tora]|uniref:Reticulon-like protein n=1 Tax=Senna tora TaxID=362788 RepID=A0A835C889_9FABA|nr:reticulon-like protein B9 [Senna tora]